MARYNRAFLVPYLHDLCALYLAERRLKNAIEQTENSIRKCSTEYYPREPVQPEAQKDTLGDVLRAVGIVFLLSFILVIAIGCAEEGGIGEFLDAVSREGLWVYVIICMLCFLIPIVLASLSSREIRKINAKAQRKYAIKVDEYRETIAHLRREFERNAKLLPSLNERLRGQQTELRKVQDLRRFVYGANVIPTHYRNFYVTVFLYDWFAHSGSDDLDMALNTYVLEEIKARLDRIIEQQSEMILNQRMMMAKQQESIDAQNRHSDMMRRKMNQLQATEDERLRYERMTETNTAVTAFFAAAKYLRDK